MFLNKSLTFGVLLLLLFGFASSCLAQEKNDGDQERKFKLSSDFNLGVSKGLTETENINSFSNFAQDSYFNLLGQSNWNRHALAFSIDVSKGGEELTGDQDTITKDRTVSGDFYGRLDYSDSFSFIAAASQKESMRDEDHPDSIYLSGEESISQARTFAFATVWKGESATLISKLHRNTITDVTQSENTLLAKSDRDQSFLRLEVAKKIEGGQISLLSGVTEIKYASSLTDRDLTGTLLGLKIAMQGQYYNMRSYIYQNNRTYSNPIFGNKEVHAGYLNLDWNIADDLTLSTNIKKSFLERNLEPLNSTGIIEKSVNISLSYNFTPEITTELRLEKYISSLDGISGDDESETKSVGFTYDMHPNVSTSGSINEVKNVNSGLSTITTTKTAGVAFNFEVTPAVALNASLAYELETSDNSSKKTNSNDLNASYFITPKLSSNALYMVVKEKIGLETSEDITKKIGVNYDVSDTLALYGTLLSENYKTVQGSTLKTSKDVGLNYKLRDNISLIGTLSQVNESSSDYGDIDDFQASLRIEGTF